MFSFDPAQYGPVFSLLLAEERLCELERGSGQRDKSEELSALTVENAFAERGVADEQMAKCCLSGMWLLFDYLDESHEISQSIPSAEGSFWHAIMHRREGDYSNAKYWFRKVGVHPLFPPLGAEAGQMVAAAENAAFGDEFLSNDSWDPFRFVDACQANARSIAGSTANGLLCRRVAQLEWRMLFDYCYRRA